MMSYKSAVLARTTETNKRVSKTGQLNDPLQLLRTRENCLGVRFNEVMTVAGRCFFDSCAASMVDQYGDEGASRYVNGQRCTGLALQELCGDYIASRKNDLDFCTYGALNQTAVSIDSLPLT